MKASELFEPEPARWGLRGDPYLWRYLKKRLHTAEMPVDPDALERFIKKEHLRLSGEEMTLNSMAYVGAFAKGGMSSGGLSGRFWLTTAIPLLRERCAAANESL